MLPTRQTNRLLRQRQRLRHRLLHLPSPMHVLLRVTHRRQARLLLHLRPRLLPPR